MGDILEYPGVKLFEGSDQERVAEFMKRVEQLSKMFDCALIPQISLIGTNIVPNIVAIAKPRLPEGKADAKPDEEPDSTVH